jgi:hypothetical protein
VESLVIGKWYGLISVGKMSAKQAETGPGNVMEEGEEATHESALSKKTSTYLVLASEETTAAEAAVGNAKWTTEARSCVKDCALDAAAAGT